MMRLLTILLLCASVTDATAAACAFDAWTRYRDTPLQRTRDGSAYLFQTRNVRIDADGAPNAYHPDDVALPCIKGKGFKGLDCPANAGYPKESWWSSVLVADPQEPTRAFVQVPPAPYAGFFVSMTTLADRSRLATDTARYVDSTVVPYLAFPGRFNAMAGTGGMGDLGFALNLTSGLSSPFIVADIAPPDADLGEISIALAKALGGTNPDPRTGSGAPTGRIVYLIFPRSRATPSWPLSVEQIAARVDALLQRAGGKEMLQVCAGAD